MTDRLFDDVVARPALMLEWSCIGVPDSLDSVRAVRGFAALQRAVAEHIALGSWCDALAWCHNAPACGSALNAPVCARRGPWCPTCERLAVQPVADDPELVVEDRLLIEDTLPL